MRSALRIRIGLVGIGGYAASHREALVDLENQGIVDWVAAADPVLADDSPERRELTSRGVRSHASLSAMLAGEEAIEALVIATPIPLHFDMVGKAVRSGLTVLLEKPPVPLLSQLNSLLAMPGSDRVAVGFQHVCSRPVRELRRLIAEGVLGEINEIRAAACWPRADEYYARAAWAGRLMLDGDPVFDGPATNALTHVIQNAMLFAARPGERAALPEIVQGEFYRARPLETYDTACLRCAFPSGVRFTAAFTHATRDLLPFRIRVIGECGTAEIGNDGSTLTLNGSPFTSWTMPDQPATAGLYKNFIAVCRGDGFPPATTLADCRGLLTLNCGALEAAGSIESIPARFIEREPRPGAGIYHVHGLADLVEQSFATGSLFSELGASWAKATPSKRTENLKGLDLSMINHQAHRLSPGDVQSPSGSLATLEV